MLLKGQVIHRKDSGKILAVFQHNIKINREDILNSYPETPKHLIDIWNTFIPSELDVKKHIVRIHPETHLPIAFCNKNKLDELLEINQVDVTNSTFPVPEFKDLIWSGSFSPYEGYGRCNWNITQELQKYDINLKLEILSKFQHRLDKNLQKLDKNKVSDYKKTMKVMMFPAIPINHAGYKIIYTMSETLDKLHSNFVRNANTFNEVWFPTQWQCDQAKDSGVTVPIYKMPLGVDIGIYHPSVEKKEFEYLVFPSKQKTKRLPKFLFYSVFVWTIRKGADCLIKAFLQEFNKQDDVGLLLITKPTCKFNVVDDIPQFYKDIDASNTCPIYTFIGNLEEEDMVRLCKNGDCYISASRGEGWNMPAIEAMAMKIPAILPYHSGFTEYATNDNSYLLDFDGYRDATDTNIFSGFYAGMKIAQMGDTVVSQLRKHMREVYSNYVSALNKADTAYQMVINNYQWKYIAKKIINRLNDIYHGL